MATETKTMNALQLVRPRSFEAARLPVPGLGSGDRDCMVIRTRWVSMCGSDVAFFAGNKRLRSYPLAAGAPIHECVGQVVEGGTEPFRAADWVAAMPDGDLGLAEYFVAQRARAVQLPAELAGSDVACLIQPLSTVINAVDRIGDVRGRSVAVVGLGSMGLMLCWLLLKRGAASILGVDPVEHRCRAAERLGVTRTWPQRSIELVHASRQGAGGWEPPEICIEAVGHQMDTLNDCFELVQKRGMVVAFGVPDHAQYTIEYEVFFRKNLHLVAVVTPEWSEYLAKARDLLLAHRGELQPLITHRYAMGDAGQAFCLYESHAAGVIKVTLDGSDWEPRAG